MKQIVKSLILPGVFYRTCQECGFEQPDTDQYPNYTTTYRERKCKNCKSEGSLDYGTIKHADNCGEGLEDDCCNCIVSTLGVTR